MFLIKWMVFKVGCLECQIDSEVVEVFDLEDDADTLAEKLNHQQGGSEAEFGVYKLEMK